MPVRSLEGCSTRTVPARVERLRPRLVDVRALYLIGAIMKIYLIGKTTAETPQGNVGEIQGAFATEAEAVVACLPHEWIGPLEIGCRVPDEPHPWPGSYYPHELTADS
jgi:hypothetical protein